MAGEPFNTILVPVDFSTCSEKALVEAINLASSSHGTVHLMHVITSFIQEEIPPYVNPAEIYKIEEEDLKALAAEALANLHNRGQHKPGKIAEKGIIRLGKPGREIVKVSKEIKADLIVLGTHGRSGFERLIAGSTAEYVVRNATCPVLTVKEETPTFIVKDIRERGRVR